MERELVAAHLRESAAVKQQLAQYSADVIVTAANVIADTFRSGNKVLLCGNGGSAADCQHMAAEFVGVLSKSNKRDGLPAIALTTDSSFITAFANDWGFENIFERQVSTFGRSGDVLIAISTSGNSENVIRAAEAARASGLQTIVLTGEGGRLTELGDVIISVLNSDTAYIQEAHLAIEHVICELVERILSEC